MKSIQHPIQLSFAFDGKVCCRCRETKPLTAYYRNRTRKDGLCHECKACRDADKKRWTAAHPEGSRKRAALWKATHPEQRKRNDARYNAVHAEQLRQRSLRYRAAHAEQVRRNTAEWAARNQTRRLVNKHNRRALVLGREGSFTVQQWEELKARWGNQCLCCFRKEPQIKLTVDHIIPFDKGGTNYLHNIQPLCMVCNARKFNHHACYRPDKLLPSP